MQLICCALAFAVASAGNSMLARIAMIAMTTKSSISVKPAERDRPARGNLNFITRDPRTMNIVKLGREHSLWSFGGTPRNRWLRIRGPPDSIVLSLRRFYEGFCLFDDWIGR